jgi:hypothetical protein
MGRNKSSALLLTTIVLRRGTGDELFTKRHAASVVQDGDGQIDEASPITASCVQSDRAAPLGKVASPSALILRTPE